MVLLHLNMTVSIKSILQTLPLIYMFGFVSVQSTVTNLF